MILTVGKAELPGWCGKSWGANTNVVISPLALDSWKLLNPSSNPTSSRRKTFVSCRFSLCYTLDPISSAWFLIFQLAGFSWKDVNPFSSRKERGFPSGACLTWHQNPLMTERLLTMKEVEILYFVLTSKQRPLTLPCGNTPQKTKHL